MYRTKRHKLIDIVTIAICAVVCGADTWVDVESFGKSKQEWFSRILKLPSGIPSHDTFGRVFAMLDAKQFEASFIEWVRTVSQVTQGQVVAIDGKTLRRSHDKHMGQGAIHLVSAWASAHRLILGQTKVDDKSNEITAIPESRDSGGWWGVATRAGGLGVHCHHRRDGLLTPPARPPWRRQTPRSPAAGCTSIPSARA